MTTKPDKNILSKHRKNGHLRKYVKEINWLDRGIGLLVVISGVLIALALESWYEGIKDNRLEQQYLQTLLEDITADIEELQETRDYIEEHHTNILKIMRIQQEKDNDKIDSVFVYAREFGNFGIFRPHSAVFNSLVQSGDLRIIKNYTLKEKLGRLYTNTYYLVNVADEVYEEFYRNHLAFLTDHINLITGESKRMEDVYSFEYNNVMVMLESGLRLQLRTYAGAIEEAEEIKTMIMNTMDK